MASKHRPSILVLFLFIFPFNLNCYEKTLRKIVRNQSKMVQQPFSISDNGNENIVWKNMSLPHGNEVLHPQVKTYTRHKIQRQKLSTIISTVDTGRTKTTYSKTKLAFKEDLPFELRMTRNTFKNYTTAFKPTTEGDKFLFPRKSPNESYAEEIKSIVYYELPIKSTYSSFFPAVDERDAQNNEEKTAYGDNAIVIPANPTYEKENSSVIVKGIFIAKSDLNNDMIPNIGNNIKKDEMRVDNGDDKPDFLIEEVVADVNSKYSYNVTDSLFRCELTRRIEADIDAQHRFSFLDIEPFWMYKKRYWDNIFDSRYEALMRSRNWPSLNVLLVPSSHADTIWKQSFEQYHNNTVGKILSNIVKKLQFYSNFTFTWNEVSHLSQWWKRTSQRKRAVFRKLLYSGRLEITTGSWVETDEATSHIFGLVHQFVEGHQWLKQNLNYVPKVGWSTNSVTHSPTLPYLLSASGISKYVMTNLHFAWEQYLAEFQYSDFIWLQDWDSNINVQTPLNKALKRIGNERYPKHSVLTHILQFNSDDFTGCGPNKEVCNLNFDFMNPSKNIAIHSYNIKQKAEMLLEQYSKTGTVTPHNVLIAPLGGRFRYVSQTEFDYQYNNYQRLSDFININSAIYKANVEFGTPKDYFEQLFSKHKVFPTLKGDFMNYADIKSGVPAYWTGFFTSRPLLKIWLRRLHSTLRSAEILMAFAVNFNVLPHYNTSNLFELLVKSRETVARLQDRHVVGGTLSFATLQYVYRTILATAKNCWYIQEIAASLLTTKPNNPSPFLKKFVYREGEFMSTFKTVSPGDHIYVFNSLNQERTEIVELITKQPNIRVVDYNKKDLTLQINPIWIYNSDNIVKISNKFFKVLFAIVVPPLTLELYKIKETYDGSQNIATIYCTNCMTDVVDSLNSAYPFNILPLEAGDIQLESYKHRIIVDETTGFVKTVIEKNTNIEKPMVIDYGSFRSYDSNAGMFLFNTNVSKPLHDILMPFRIGIKKKIFLIVSGLVTSEMSSIYGRLLQHTVKLFNLLTSPLSNSIYFESKLDYEISPKHRELETFLSIKTDINNGNNPEIFIDNNGFQFTPRVINITRRVESNMFPMTSMAYIQDYKSRVTIITDHAQAVTALQEGHLVVMLDRRVLFDDGRGLHEGLADSSATYHRHYLLLENFKEHTTNQYKKFSSKAEMNLPSFSALRLANSVDYMLDIFIVNKKYVSLSYYAFLPLVKTSFPCDVVLINFRVILNKAALQQLAANTALVILHRQGVSCRIDDSILLPCKREAIFSLDKIFHNTKAAFLTNLVGTDDGVPMATISEDNFSTMEIITLKIFF